MELIGGGANGKGILEDIKSNVHRKTGNGNGISGSTSIKIRSQDNSQQDLWILSEVSDVAYAINLLKKVSTGEMIDSSAQWGNRVSGVPHALPTLDCNDAVDYGDDSWGRTRRIVKLDFPYRFDNTEGTRPKDTNWKDVVTSPEALSGLLQIIIARAPSLCESREIYTRKRHEMMDAEHKRQRYSLRYFCEDCIGTTAPKLDEHTKEAPKLTTDALYEEYLEYCKLFNVTIPETKVSTGRYISKTFEVKSEVTTINDESTRYYPNLWIKKSAKDAYDGLAKTYSKTTDESKNYSGTTDKLQEKEDENGIICLTNYRTTHNYSKKVCVEIEKMYKFIEGCDSQQDISYKKYLENLVIPVVL